MKSHQPPLSASARKNLIAARKRKKLTQRAAAELCGISVVLLCNLERGKYGVMLSTLEGIADKLGLCIDLRLIPRKF